MKAVFISFCCLIMLLIVGYNASAQSYFNTLGVRLGNGTEYRSAGLTYQQRVLKDFTVEGILQTDFSKNTTAHALFEYHHPILSKRLNYYVGAGLMSGREMTSHTDSTRSFQSTIFGADLIAGIEVTLLKFTISLDYKPNFNITGREQWFTDQVGVSVRAVILSGQAIAKKQRVKAREKAQTERKDRREDRMSRPLFQKKNN
jgi:hypothetical protein